MYLYMYVCMYMCVYIYIYISGLLTRLLVPRPRRDRDYSRHNPRRDRDVHYTRRDRDVYINSRDETETRRLFYCLKHYMGPCELHVQQCLITPPPSCHFLCNAIVSSNELRAQVTL